MYTYMYNIHLPSSIPCPLPKAPSAGGPLGQEGFGSLERKMHYDHKFPTSQVAPRGLGGARPPRGPPRVRAARRGAWVGGRPHRLGPPPLPWGSGREGGG